MSIRRWRIRPTSRTGAGRLDVSSTPGKAERSVEGLTPEEAKANPDPKSLRDRVRLPSPSEQDGSMLLSLLSEVNEKLLAEKAAKDKGEG
jgi:hypothetical protein